MSPRETARTLKAAHPWDPSAWDALNGLFRTGRPPEPGWTGDCDGELLATRTAWPWDSLARRFDRQGLWWLGKSFDRAAETGENRLDTRFRQVFRLIWPLYRDIRPVSAAELRALSFRTSIGPGVLDPDRHVLKIDYSLCPNPFLVRRILDELVQVAPDYAIGKAHVRLPGRWRTVAFFALSLRDDGA